MSTIGIVVVMPTFLLVGYWIGYWVGAAHERSRWGKLMREVRAEGISDE